MAKLKMPRLGETITEGMIVRWLKREGDFVKKDELIVEISTDKVDSEIPSPFEGVLSKIYVFEGETVPVETELALIEEKVPGVPPPEVSKAPPEAPKEEPIPTISKARREAVSPLVRKLAKEHGIDLSQVKGSGEGGRITKKDVLRFIEQERVKAAPPPEAPPEKEISVGPREEVVPLSHVRKMIAEHMVRSRQTAAHVTAVIETDMTDITHLRERAKEKFKEQENFSLTYLPFVAKATVEALEHFPVVNSALQGDKLILKRYINLGIAVAYEEGLIVPVVKGAETLSLIGLARSINDLARRAREKRLHPDEVHEGTFTITNTGTFGSIIQTPIINQPQVAILSLERVTKRPAVVDEAIAIRDMVYLCLSYDHRVIDGALAGKFLSHIKNTLETQNFEPELSEVL